MLKVSHRCCTAAVQLLFMPLVWISHNSMLRSHMKMIPWHWNWQQRRFSSDWLLELCIAATFLLQCEKRGLIEGQMELCHSDTYLVLSTCTKQIHHSSSYSSSWVFLPLCIGSNTGICIHLDIQLQRAVTWMVDSLCVAGTEWNFSRKQKWMWKIGGRFQWILILQ
jgi:hypothetical protein